MGDWPLAVLGLAAILCATTGLWLVSLARRDASIIDVFWGLGFVGLAWLYWLGGRAGSPRQPLLVALVTIWGVRLALHLLLRSRGRGEDYRYREMRERRPRGFALWSLGFVFTLQALLLWVVALPLYQVGREPRPEALAPLDALGAALFALGFGFEAVADWQLSRFRRDPANAGRVLDRGLWRYSRHPNYFGDALAWWGFFCFAAATRGGGWTLVSPLLMSLLLMRVSGVTLLERRLREVKPAYREYAERTSAFFPWPPRAVRGSCETSA